MILNIKFYDEKSYFIRIKSSPKYSIHFLINEPNQALKFAATHDEDQCFGDENPLSEPDIQFFQVSFGVHNNDIVILLSLISKILDFVRSISLNTPPPPPLYRR